jgi:hypothetical protein
LTSKIRFSVGLQKSDIAGVIPENRREDFDWNVSGIDTNVCMILTRSKTLSSVETLTSEISHFEVIMKNHWRSFAMIVLDCKCDLMYRTSCSLKIHFSLCMRNWEIYGFRSISPDVCPDEISASVL